VRAARERQQQQQRENHARYSEWREPDPPIRSSFFKACRGTSVHDLSPMRSGIDIRLSCGTAASGYCREPL
jgi:hypothetical protein